VVKHLGVSYHDDGIRREGQGYCIRLERVVEFEWQYICRVLSVILGQCMWQRTARLSP